MRKLILVTAASMAAVVVWLLATLPPAPSRRSLDGLDPDLRRRTIAGAYHIHTSRSDGAEPKAAIAAAAAKAGLQFAVFTDHGDGSEPSDPPEYIDGVLCIDAVEISTNGGHYVAIGLPAAPYPLGGEAAAVVEDVARLGGLGIAAHPDHPKAELAWTDWRAPIDGLEWINADAEWRDERAPALARVLFGYLLRPVPALASVLDRPVRTLERWDELNRAGAVVGLAAIDAHGGGRHGSGGGDEGRPVVGPSYEAGFRTLSNRLLLERPLTGDAASDAAVVLGALRAGRSYTVVDAISPDVLVSMDRGRLDVLSPLAGGAVHTFDAGASRRLEVHAPGAPGAPPVPWVLTNWVSPGSHIPVRRPEPGSLDAPATSPMPLGDWRIEKEPESSGEVLAGTGTVTAVYRLRAGVRASQFVAAAVDLTANTEFNGLAFEGRATGPMRVSVQLRFRPDDRRWVKSIYLDQQARRTVVLTKDMVSAERPAAAMPPVTDARSLLFVVDLGNAKPGSAGSFTISGLGVIR